MRKAQTAQRDQALIIKFKKKKRNVTCTHGFILSGSEAKETEHFDNTDF